MGPAACAIPFIEPSLTFTRRLFDQSASVVDAAVLKLINQQLVTLAFDCRELISAESPGRVRTHSYGRSLAKLPGLAPGDLDLPAVIELNV
jgi:hypothetical protein